MFVDLPEPKDRNHPHDPGSREFLYFFGSSEGQEGRFRWASRS
jgi:hypothetical protein